MSNPSKSKGTSWETAIKSWLAFRGVIAKRKVLTGNQDEGDLEVVGVPWLVIEAKNCQKMELAKWVDEAEVEADNAVGVDGIGVVWHHRPRKSSPGDGYVTMSGDSFFRLLRQLAPALPPPVE